MTDYSKTRRLLLDIDKIMEKKGFANVYYILTTIVNDMAIKYNLQEEEIQKQLNLIIKAIKR